jgi:hypothetical protein
VANAFILWLDNTGKPIHNVRQSDGVLCACLLDPGEVHWVTEVRYVHVFSVFEMYEAVRTFAEQHIMEFPNRKIFTVHPEPVSAALRNFMLMTGRPRRSCDHLVRSIIDDQAAVVPWDFQRRVACTPGDLDLLLTGTTQLTDIELKRDTVKDYPHRVFNAFATITNYYLSCR